MPTLGENIQNWKSGWDWSGGGEEWSWWWGDTPSLWYGAILPRIHTLVPAPTILELAPGFGRWSAYLIDLCEQLVLVDMTDECIAHCRRRFADRGNVEFHVNDGRSLAMVPDRTIDFVFSFDSLVHADPDVIGVYLAQLALKLRPDGIGFIHHSNAGALRRLNNLSRRLPGRLFGPLMRRGVAVNLAAWRDEGMSADRFQALCHESGLSCVTQELVSWEYGAYLLDCFSVITPTGSGWSRPTRRSRNPMFVAEAARMSRLYARSSFDTESRAGPG